MKPRIAIPVPNSTRIDYVWRALPQYERAVRAAGGEPVVIDVKGTNAEIAQAVKLCDGVLLPGSPADVVVFDPDAPWVLDRDDLKSKCKNTPFDEARLTGRVVRTIVAGRTVYEFV